MIKKLHTKQLLKLLANSRLYGNDGIATKFIDGKWYEFTREELKEELDCREHIPNKMESKQKRREMAKRKG